MRKAESPPGYLLDRCLTSLLDLPPVGVRNRMLRDDFSALKEKHADAVYKMMMDRGVDLMTCSEAEKRCFGSRSLRRRGRAA
jgi:hypothetical protein